MFNIWHYVTHDEVAINPVDLMAEKRSAANRLYLGGVEMLRKREENMRLKRLEEERDLARELQAKPTMNQTSKDILFRNNRQSQGRDFFEYNMDWKQRVDKKLENERKAKEEFEKLEAEEELQRIKEARLHFLKSKSQQRLAAPDQANSKERVPRVHGDAKPPDADQPSNGELTRQASAPRYRTSRRTSSGRGRSRSGCCSPSWRRSCRRKSGD